MDQNTDDASPLKSYIDAHRKAGTPDEHINNQLLQAGWSPDHVTQTMQTVPAPAVSSLSGEVWPGAFGIYKTSRTAVKCNLRTILSLIALLLAVTILSSILGRQGGMISIVGGVLSLIVSYIIAAGIAFVLLASAKGKTIELAPGLQRGVSTAGRLLLFNLLIGAMAACSLVLLVIPFFYVLFFVIPRLTLATYFSSTKAPTWVRSKRSVQAGKLPKDMSARFGGFSVLQHYLSYSPVRSLVFRLRFTSALCTALHSHCCTCI